MGGLGMGVRAVIILGGVGERRRASGLAFDLGRRMTPRSVVGTLLVAAALACGGEPDVAVIGYAFPSGGAASVAVARDEIAGWPAGLPIEIVYDSGGVSDLPDVEVERALRLVTVPDLVAVVGHGGSRASLAAAPVYHDAGVPQVVPTSTSRLIAHAGPWTFPLAPNDSLEGAFIADFVADRLGARRVLLFYVNDEYGEGLREGTRAGLAHRGLAVIDEMPVDPQSDFPTLVDAALLKGTPDAVIVAARWEETGRIARHLTARAANVPVVAGDGAMLLPALLQHAGPAISSICVVTFWLPDSPDSVSQAYADRFRRLNGREPTGPDAMTHDALMVVAQAVRTVGADRVAIARFLRALGRTRPPYRGVTGPITFLPDRAVEFVMARFEDGRAVRVAP